MCKRVCSLYQLQSRIILLGFKKACTITIILDVFLSLCMAMMVTSLLETILITNLLCGSAHYPPVPHWIQVFVLHILGRLVQLPPKPRDLEETVFQNPAAQGKMTNLSVVLYR